jgi:hypothetical protein
MRLVGVAMARYTFFRFAPVNYSFAADMDRFRFARLHGGTLALLLLTASSVLAQSNGNAAPAASTPLPTGLLAPLPAGTQTPPPGFVIVQTTYLESLVAAQKATLDSVAATSQTSINAGRENVKAIAEVSQSAITAARDKEEWLVRLAQTIGIVFSAMAALLTYFGITRYSEVKGWLAEIEQSKTRTVELRDETLEKMLAKWRVRPAASTVQWMH